MRRVTNAAPVVRVNGKRDAHWDRSGRMHHRLAVLPGLTHYDINLGPTLAQTVIPFLEGAPSR